MKLNSLGGGGKETRGIRQDQKVFIYAAMLRAPRSGMPFKFYIAVEENIIGVVLTQEAKRREHVITYVSRRLLDAETRYVFIEK